MAKFKQLTVVVPALNEEEAIRSTLERCLAARDHIRERTGLATEVVMVSDGSTDSTEDLARQFDEVAVLGFEENRGYGAAIKCGFDYGSGDIVGFLDADGTCDPRIFADLCERIVNDEADVVLGSRMGPDSEMPLIRTIGNTLFAAMLGVLSKRTVGDTASGMRAIRRDCLEHLYPLPDGLHFTPAMSARVLLEDRLRLAEVPMPYAERIGDSKLSVVRDGVRFLRVISLAALCYRPARPLLLVAAVVGLLAVLLGLQPIGFYAENARLEEGMIYRILMSSLLATLTALCVCAAAVADRAAATIHRRRRYSAGVSGLLARVLSLPWAALPLALLLGLGVWTVWPGLEQYARERMVDMHWSRAVFASLLVVLAGVVGVTSFLLSMLELIRAQQDKPAATPPADRERAAA